MKTDFTKFILDRLLGSRSFGLIHQRKVTKKDGTEFEIRFQEAEILQENRRPRVVEISIQNQGHYEEGLYTLSAESFRPDMYEKLEMAYPKLTPLDEALKLGAKENKT